MIDAAHLAGRSLKDDVAERDLAVAAIAATPLRRTHRIVVP